jgi:general secretion pathway protein D
MRLRFSFLPLSVLAARSLFAQVAPPIMVPSEPPVQQPAQSQPQPARPQGPGAPALSTQPAEPGKPLEPGLFQLDNTSLTDMVNVLAKRLKINIIVDPKVNGAVTIHTYGEVKPVDLMPLLETVLRVNHASLVKVGDLYHVVPVNSISQLPIDPLVNADGKTLPDDERMILDLIFLKYATATEIEKLIKPFLGEGASDSVYEPANLIIIQDNSRNMRRTLDLLAMFDSDTFAGQRVRLFEIENSRPTDLVKELDSVFKAYALSEKASAVKFIPVDRINTADRGGPEPGHLR